MVFDFRKISYVDSSGRGILVSAKKRLGADRGEVVLITTQPAVLKALSLSGLDQIIRIYPTEEEYFGGGGGPVGAATPPRGGGPPIRPGQAPPPQRERLRRAVFGPRPRHAPAAPPAPLHAVCPISP